MGYRPIEADLSGPLRWSPAPIAAWAKEAARELARMGAEVMLGCRSRQRGEAARNKTIQTTGQSGVTVMEVDLSSPASVRVFAHGVAARFPKLDVLVNNAAASLRAREVTPDGFERHRGDQRPRPHWLTKLLLPALASGHAGSSPSQRWPRVAWISLGYQWERRPYNGTGAYRASKQAARMVTWALADRLGGTPVAANADSPGYVLSDLTRNVGGLLKVVVVLTSWRAQTPLDGDGHDHLAGGQPGSVRVTGKFWKNRREARCRFRDPATVEQPWTLVEQQTAASA